LEASLFNDVELRDKELSKLKDDLQRAEEDSHIYSIEAEEMRKQNTRLQAELETQRKAPVPVAQVATPKMDYFEQLRQAQSNLKEHNDKISQLLGQIDIVKETEEKKRKH